MTKDTSDDLLLDDDFLGDEDDFDQSDELKNDQIKSSKQRQAAARLKLEDILEERRLRREIEDYFK
jgi:hypothetical protein